MTFKDGVWVTLGIIFVIGLFVGLFWFLAWDNEQDTKANQEDCANIAKIARLKEWKADGYSDCYLLKDGKIVEVNP
jgi:hypothetical protein